MEVSYDFLLKKAAAYCSRQEVCSADIEKKLQTWGASTDQSVKLIAWLISEKYIDNERFCRSFANDKFRFNKWGKMKIAQALRFKQIPESIVDRVLREMDVSLYEEKLLVLLQKKVGQIKASGDYERKMKLLNFALQRGFEYALADRVIKKMNV